MAVLIWYVDAWSQQLLNEWYLWLCSGIKIKIKPCQLLVPNSDIKYITFNITLLILNRCNLCLSCFHIVKPGSIPPACLKKKPVRQNLLTWNSGCSLYNMCNSMYLPNVIMIGTKSKCNLRDGLCHFHVDSVGLTMGYQYSSHFS